MFRMDPGASKRYVVEPYFRAEYLDISIDSFTEVETDSDGIAEYFNLAVHRQLIECFVLSFGARVSMAIFTSWAKSATAASRLARCTTLFPLSLCSCALNILGKRRSRYGHRQTKRQGKNSYISAFHLLSPIFFDR